MKRERTALGLSALALAQQMDMLAASPGALPGALARDHAAALARALGRSAPWRNCRNSRITVR